MKPCKRHDYSVQRPVWWRGAGIGQKSFTRITVCSGCGKAEPHEVVRIERDSGSKRPRVSWTLPEKGTELV